MTLNDPLGDGVGTQRNRDSFKKFIVTVLIGSFYSIPNMTISGGCPPNDPFRGQEHSNFLLMFFKLIPNMIIFGSVP